MQQKERIFKIFDAYMYIGRIDANIEFISR